MGLTGLDRISGRKTFEKFGILSSVMNMLDCLK